MSLSAAWLQIERMDDFDFPCAAEADAFKLRRLLGATGLASSFGCLHGGNASTELSRAP